MKFSNFDSERFRLALDEAEAIISNLKTKILQEIDSQYQAKRNGKIEISKNTLFQYQKQIIKLYHLSACEYIHRFA